MICKNQKGFTLVELAIVVLVISSLVGTILIFQSLLQASRIRSQIKQVEEYRRATNAFDLKYLGLPGDFVRASIYGLGANGDGNRVIGDNLNVNEPRLYWLHLGNAGLINYDVNLGGFPLAEIEQGFVTIYYSINDVETYFHVGYQDDQNDDSFRPLESYQVDLKLDDGEPTNGFIMARGAGPTGTYGVAPSEGPPGTGADVCITDVDPKQYYFTNDERRCSLDIVLLP